MADLKITKGPFTECQRKERECLMEDATGVDLGFQWAGYKAHKRCSVCGFMIVFVPETTPLPRTAVLVEDTHG